MPGFQVEQFMDGLSGARTLRTAPNGDIFVAQLDEGGQIVVIRADRHMRHPRRHVYASGLGTPYGIAFHPPGPDPQWIYIARADAVIRYRYRNGDLKPTGQPETVVSGLPGGGHWTRDLAFSADGGTMYVSVGSASNVAESMGEPPADLPAFEKERAPGAAWGNEEWRAAVLAFDPQGRNRRIFASGLRNCSGLAIRPGSDDLYCAVNERDRLGDNLPPDYVTRVASGAFYGWPWFYIGPHPDDRAQGSPRPELAKAVRIPDVLLQAHSAPLGMAFHRGDPGGQFPPQWKGDLFVALHGSWNRKLRTGYKIVRLPFENGRPTGAYQDFVVGFALDDERSVWGRPTGLTFAADGSLLFSDDSRGIIYRVSRPGMAH